MRTTLLGAAALATLALTPTAAGAAVPAAPAAAPTAAPASARAAVLDVTDPQDLRHGVDLRAVQVRQSARNLVVTTTHTDLVEDPASGSSGAVFLDTDPADAGPEYVLLGGYFVGTDYMLVTTEGWARSSFGEPVEGSYRMKVDHDADQVRLRISREAIGSPDEVAVAVRVAGLRPDGRDTRTDWLGSPRSFTEPVGR